MVYFKVHRESYHLILMYNTDVYIIQCNCNLYTGMYYYEGFDNVIHYFQGLNQNGLFWSEVNQMSASLDVQCCFILSAYSKQLLEDNSSHPFGWNVPTNLADIV